MQPGREREQENGRVQLGARSYAFSLGTLLSPEGKTVSAITAHIQEEFGPGAVPADWSSLKGANPSRSELLAFLDALDIRNAHVLVDGRTSSDGGSRSYFIERHDGKVPSGWLVHDTIQNNILDLGSWQLTLPWLVDVTETADPEDATKYGWLLRKYSRLMLKGLAGLMRLLMEDVLNLFVQGCFLVKFWDRWGWLARVFTITSMMAGLTCSCAGPVKDLMGAYAQRREASDGGAGFRLDDGTRVDDQQQPGKDGEPDSTEPKPEAAEDIRVELLNVEAGEESKAPKRQKVVHYTGRLTDFIADATVVHSKLAHRLLIACSVAYWTSMALIPVLFGSGIEGGEDSSIPSGAV